MTAGHNDPDGHGGHPRRWTMPQKSAETIKMGALPFFVHDTEAPPFSLEQA